MPELRRRIRQSQDQQADGLYIHSSPPRVLQINSAYIKQLIRNGDTEKLLNLVLEGQGKRLVGGYSADYKTRTFLKSVPSMMSKINLMHDAVNSDRLEELQTLLDDEPERKKIVLAKDEAGVGLLHKAVYYNLVDIAKYLITNFPQTSNVKDSEGRTPYHYTPLCKEPVEIQKMLVSAGADPTVMDNRQRSIKYYMNHSSELELPSKHKTTASPRKSLANRDGAAIKKSNIRIWIHQRDMAHLQQVVWEGHGSKLLVEHSNNAKVKRFLEVVPHIMGLIRDIHTNVLNDDLKSLKTNSSTPVPPIVLSGKDINGLAPLHKAAGLGRENIVEYIIETFPNSLFQVDNEGRTPLHYAALTKDDGKIFDLLISSGADESALDNKQKTAAYYKTRNSEIDQKLLQVVPECPRGAKENFAATWDWNLLSASPSTDSISKTIKKIINEADESVKAEETVEETEEKEEPKADEVEEPKPEEPTAEEPTAEEPAAEEPAPEEPKAEEEVEEKKEEESKEEAGEEPKEENATQVETNGQTEKTEEEKGEEVAETKGEDEANNNNDEDEEEKEDSDSKRDYVNEDLMKQIDKTVEEAPAEEANKNEVKKEEVVEPLVNAEEGVIEGIVNGENEVESVNEQGQKIENGDKLDDVDISSLIEEGNMEQLAALVLNGDGEKLVGYSSENPELQAFLENVPTYMSKINRIHVSARDGSLRDLQAALDRRKFAIAKDHISPNEASPLHVATVFGNTSIVRYLAGRFPETVQSTDSNGRTPLHYAAVLADNGHYFNLLVHLGADIRAQDKFGHTPDYYRSHQDDFSHVILLREFGAEEAAQEILNDKVSDDSYSARKNLDDPDMIAVLEKCYIVLHGRRNSHTVSASSTTTTMSEISTASSVGSKHLKRYVFDLVKLRLTKLDHNLYDVIWPSVKKLPQEKSFKVALEEDFPLGLIAPDFSAYKVFKEYLEPIIKEWNWIDLHSEIKDQPDTQFFDDENHDYKNSEFNFDLDPYGKWIINSTLESTRNLANFELPTSLNIDELEEVEKMITSVLLKPETTKALNPGAPEEDLGDKGSGNYYTMNEVLEDPSEIRVVLAANGLLIPLWNIPESDRLHGRHWPYGRGVFVSTAGNVAVWINVLDHIRIVTCTSANKPANVGHIYSRVYRLMSVLESELSFVKDEKLGFLSARPTAIGNTLHFNLTVKFPHLMKEPNNLKHLCTTRALTFTRLDSSSSAIKISNQQCLGITEQQTLEDFSTAVTNILQLEKDLAMTNSLHIAELFVNIFRRKRSGLINP